MRKIFAIVLVSISAINVGCSTTAKTQSSKNEPTETPSAMNIERGKEAAQSKPLFDKNIYTFQHKLISHWVFESNGEFFSDMMAGNTLLLSSAASKIINQDYAARIKVTPIQNRDAVLITFPKPDDVLLCYFAVIERKGSEYKYITYEKTFSFGDAKHVGVVGGWNKQGDHLNFGPRSYTTSAEFVEDALKEQ